MCTVKHILTALMVIAISRTGAGKKEVFEKVQDSAHFVKAGAVILANERADIILDTDLFETKHIIEDSCQLAKFVAQTFNQSMLRGPLRYRLWILCEEDKTRWRGIFDAASGDEDIPRIGEIVKKLKKSKRFAGVAAILASSLAAGVAGALWGEGKTKTEIERMAKQQNKIVSVLKKEENRLNIEGSHLREIAITLGSEGEKRRLTATMEQSLDVLLAMFVTSGMELARIENILEAVITEGRLPPGAFAPGCLQAHLKKVREMGEAKGLTPAVETEADLLRLPVSYGTFSSGLMRVVIHVPMATAGNEFVLWSFINAAKLVENSNVYGRVARTDAENLLAVQDDGSHFFETSKAELGRCWRRQDSHFICAPTPVKTAKAGSCLWAIHKGSPTGKLKYCTMVHAGTDPIVEKVAAGLWLLCHQEGHFASVRCDGQTTASVVAKGCWLTRLQPGCQLSSEQYRVNGERESAWDEVLLHRPPLQLNALNLSEMVHQAEDGSWLPAELLKDRPLHLAGKIRTGWTPSRTLLGGLGLSLAVVLATWMMICWSYHRHRRAGRRIHRRLDAGGFGPWSRRTGWQDEQPRGSEALELTPRLRGRRGSSLRGSLPEAGLQRPRSQPSLGRRSGEEGGGLKTSGTESERPGTENATAMSGMMTDGIGCSKVAIYEK